MSGAGRNVVLCCDGTANEFAVDRTNVVKLYYSLQKDREQQIAYYHPGLGTMEPPGALTGFVKGTTRLLGQAIGYGLESDIRDAYVFLMNNFRRDDLVFLFGFSRGAYTVRAVASLLKMFGLLPPGNDAFVPYAIRIDIERKEKILGRRGGPFVAPNPNGKLHVSLDAGWWPAEFVFKRHFDWTTGGAGRRMNLGRRRTIRQTRPSTRRLTSEAPSTLRCFRKMP